MKDGFRVMDSDLHVIEDAAVYENHFTGPHRDAMPRYLGWSPTKLPALGRAGHADTAVGAR